MPKQSRVKKPAPIDLVIFQRLCKLETNATNAEDIAEGQQIFESRILSKFNDLSAETDERINALQGQNVQVRRDLETTQRALLNLDAKVGSDFQDQDDEIEKISCRLQSVEDKLKGKVELVNAAQREVNEAYKQIAVLESELQAASRERDAALVRADHVQRELNEAGNELTQLKFKLEAANRPRRWFS